MRYYLCIFDHKKGRYDLENPHIHTVADESCAGIWCDLKFFPDNYFYRSKFWSKEHRELSCWGVHPKYIYTVIKGIISNPYVSWQEIKNFEGLLNKAK